MDDLPAQKLLAMAEYFRQRNDIKRAIKCTLGASKVAQSDAYKILTVYQTGKLYHHYTINSEEAEKYLEVSYNQMCQHTLIDPNRPLTIFEGMRHYRLEAVCILAEIYIHSGRAYKVEQFYKNDYNDSRQHLMQHVKIAFLCAEAFMHERKVELAYHVLDQLIHFLQSMPDTGTMPLYALISKLHVSCHLLNDLPANLVEPIGNALKAMNPDDPVTKNLQLYFMSVQLAHFAEQGMIRTSKSMLRMLQGAAQQKAPLMGLKWADHTFITGLTCIMTQLTCQQHCVLDRTIKYYQHTVKNETDYNTTPFRPYEPSMGNCFRRLRMVADETMAQSLIVACRLGEALMMIRGMAEVMSAFPELKRDFLPRTHLLLGILALYFEDETIAERQFSTAASQLAPYDTRFATVIACHRGLLYLSQARQGEFYDLDEYLNLSRSEREPLPVRAMIRFVHGFHAYLNNKMIDCKTRVSEVLDLTRSEDMFRMHTLAILLCSSLNMQFTTIVDTLKPTIDWSERANDISMLLWTNSQIIASLERSGGPEADITASHSALKANFDTLVEQQTALKAHPNFNFIQWTTESFDAIFPSKELQLQLNL